MESYSFVSPVFVLVSLCSPHLIHFRIDGMFWDIKAWPRSRGRVGENSRYIISRLQRLGDLHRPAVIIRNHDIASPVPARLARRVDEAGRIDLVPEKGGLVDGFAGPVAGREIGNHRAFVRDGPGRPLELEEGARGNGGFGEAIGGGFVADYWRGYLVSGVERK